MNKTSFDIQVTDKCNLHCKHCLMDSSMGIFDKTDFDKIIKILHKQQKVDTIYLSGGDPGIGNIPGILKLMNEFPNTKYKLVTNLCYPLTKERIELIKRVDSIQTSFDIHIRFGNIKNLVRWYHNCKYIINNIRSDLEVVTTINKYSVKKDPNRFYKFFKNMNFSSYVYFHLSCLGSLHRNMDIYVDKDEYKTWMLKVLEIEDYKNNTIRVIVNKEWLGCNYHYTQPIDPHGNLVHCAAHERSNDNCWNREECMTCKFFNTKCGGACCSTPCMFDEEIYDKAKEIVDHWNKTNK